MTNGKIEENCIARIVNLPATSGNLGKIFTVGEFIGNQPGYPDYSRIWEIDVPVRTYHNVLGRLPDIYFIDEKFLQRIDDGNLTEEELEAEEELVLISDTGEEIS